MKKLTKKQRNLIYKRTLRDFRDYYGLCAQIQLSVPAKFYSLTSTELVQKYFPELLLFKPDKLFHHYWWRNNDSYLINWSEDVINQRKQILMFCIEMTNE